MCSRWKLRPRQMTGDAKYGTVENVAAIEREHMRAYVPLSDVGRRPELFGEQDFIYDAATDAYRCPGRATLRFISQCDVTRRRVYEARSEEHTSELQSRYVISYAVFCLKKKK